MDKKNLIGRTMRTGILVTAAAAMVMCNMSAFAAEDDQQEPAGFFWNEDFISGTVTEVGSDSITVRVMGAMEDAGFEMGMPGNGMQAGQPAGGQGMGMPGGQGMGMPDGQTPPELPDGQTPPERPEGELPDGQTPPELPDGQTPPELPDGELPELQDGELPELPQGIGNMMGGMPEGGQPQGGMPQGGMPQGGQPQGEMPQGGQGMGMPSMGSELGSEVSVSITDSTVITKGFSAEDATLSDITAGSMVIVSLDGDTAVSVVIMN